MTKQKYYLELKQQHIFEGHETVTSCHGLRIYNRIFRLQYPSNSMDIKQ